MSNLIQVEALKDSLNECRQILNAIGNKTRLGIISTLLEVNYKGMRVGEIANHSKLSRPAVSHHLKVLLKAEVVGCYPRGTRNFYYIQLGGEWQKFVALINTAEKFRLEEAKESNDN